jgi:hypothetical protein
MPTKPKKPKYNLNIKLLRKVQKFLLEEPRRFDMGDWLQPASLADVIERPPCGTACCIAGAAYILEHRLNPNEINFSQINPSVVHMDAMGILGLDYRMMDGLFYASRWPDEFRDAYYHARTPLERAKAGVARIEHLIKTGE